MKLELKHIAPYLAFKLQATDNLNGIYELTMVSVEKYGVFYEFIDPKCHYAIWGKHGKLKPILRPLSDLTKEIEINGEIFMPYNIIEKNTLFGQKEILLNCITNDFDEPIHNVPFVIIQYLFEWHFDVFSLIKEGLAIDINTLKTK